MWVLKLWSNIPAISIAGNEQNCLPRSLQRYSRWEEPFRTVAAFNLVDVWNTSHPSQDRLSHSSSETYNHKGFHTKPRTVNEGHHAFPPCLREDTASRRPGFHTNLGCLQYPTYIVDNIVRSKLVNTPRLYHILLPGPRVPRHPARHPLTPGFIPQRHKVSGRGVTRLLVFLRV